MRVVRLSALFATFLLLHPASAPARDAMNIPFRWTPGQIEIQVSIEGKPPIWFILDSGAEFSMLDREIGKTFKLGDERIKNVTIRIGPVTLKNQTLRLWNLDNFRRQKRDIRGVIGCELFERYVVTIDFQKQLILLNEPSSFHPNPSGRSLPITFSGRLPVIDTYLRAHGNLIPAKLMVDTGASQAVILRHPFATKHRLFAPDYEATTSETVASGVRSFIPLSIQELILDRWKFKKPRAEAYATTAGAGGDTSTDGLLGNEVLQHFRVTFDYSRNRIVFDDS